MRPNNHQVIATVPAPEAVTGVVAPPREILDQQQAHQVLEQEFALAAQHDTPLSVIIADLNSLKAVNDELGHKDGDEYIDMVRGTITAIVGELRTYDSQTERPADVISVSKINTEEFEAITGHAGRIGGDEFLIILPNTDEQGAKSVAERIQSTVHGRIDSPEGDKFRERNIAPGLAVGVATREPHMRSSTDLLHVADGRMYTDKMSQLPELTDQEIEHLKIALQHLSETPIRPRDLPRFIEWLGARGIQHALSTDIKHLELTEKLF